MKIIIKKKVERELAKTIEKHLLHSYREGKWERQAEGLWECPWAGGVLLIKEVNDEFHYEVVEVRR
jgi:hypothetical protein